ncbi:hypothetical protein MJO29_009425 [Puccinia striiformis f. sp. tritici]|nr:hypothetical protein MJO29_009425 [Puccinia striiformis f. sp. tritici]
MAMVAKQLMYDFFYMKLDLNSFVKLLAWGAQHSMPSSTNLFARASLRTGDISTTFLEHWSINLYPIYDNLNPKDDASERLEDPKFHAFKKCLGALDGVMIPIGLPISQQRSYQDRKQVIAQNVIVVVNFNLEFLYVLAGWEGRAHDSRVIVWYHLKEQATCGLKPANPKELFNLCHTSLRNVVERIFGCLKAKFKILTTPSEHNVHSQVQLVYAITMLWNFLRRHNQYEDIPEVDKVAQANQEEDDNLNSAATGNLYCQSRAADLQA